MGHLRWYAVLAAFAVIVAACGQRPGVFEAVDTVGNPVSGSSGERDLALDGGAVDAGDDGTPDLGTDGQAAASSGGSAARDATRGVGDAARKTTAKVDDGPVWGDEITVGIHAPVTGAASLKADAFEAGKDLYWKYLERRGTKVHGRTVNVVFEDDRYNPSTASQLCRQMIDGRNAFMLVGAAGTDQIVECARLASRKNVPYLSAGVTENVVSTLPNYFALSMSYPAQGPLLAKHLKTLERQDACRARGATCDNQMRIGLIVSNTENFDDAAEGFREAFREEFGRDVDYFKVVPKNPSPSDAQAQAAELRRWNNARGIDVVFILSTVTFTVNLATSLDEAYRPRFVGVGITMVNQGVDLACPDGAFQGAHYYNPYPAWADRNRFDAEFDKAVTEQGHQSQNVPAGGDLMWSLWTLSRVIHEALDHAGRNLTQGGFIRAMESFSYGERRAYADLAYSPDDHFGATTAHLLEAQCRVEGGSRGQFVTLQTAW